MKTMKAAIALLFSFLITIISGSPILAQSASLQKTLSVEGEWEQISASSDPWRVNNGKRLLVTRRGDGYEVKWRDSASGIILSGNETRIVRTRLEDLSSGRHGAGSPMPDSVRQKVAGQKVPINESFTLSADGNFLQQARDGRWVYWNTEETGQGKRYIYTHYEIKPGFYTATYKRVAGPAAVAKAAPAPVPLVNTAVSGPPPQKDPALQRQKEAHNLNEQGARYYQNKQWQLAAEAFKAALEKSPDDQTIRSNYELASAHLAAEQAKAAGRQPAKARAKDGTPLEEPGDRKASRQLKSADHHGAMAKGLTDEAALKAEAMKGFDKSGSTPSTVDLRDAGKRPGWPAWVKDDKVMLGLQEQQDEWKAMHQHKEEELAQIRQRMAVAGPSEKSILAVMGAKIKEEVLRAEYQIGLKEKDIRERARQLIESRKKDSQ